MKKVVKSIILVVFAVILSSETAAGSDNAGSFMEKGSGARAVSLGSSFVGLADDSSAVFWNAAGLVQLQRQQASVMSYRAFETNYFNADYHVPFAGLHWGAGITGAVVDGIIPAEYDSVSKRHKESGSAFGYKAMAVYLSTAYRITDNFSAGITGKIIQEKLYSKQASGYGLDAGLMYKPSEHISFGLNVQNLIRPQLEWDTASKNVDSIPLNIKTGSAISLFNNTLIVLTDLNFRKNRPVIINVGVEYWLNRYLAVRSGVEIVSDQLSVIGKRISKLEKVSCGVGLVLNPVRLDFSWSNNDLSGLDAVYRISAGLDF
ncbi:MAG: PorV/PorQ family protein [Lentisphaerae bacterium]|nr:PorV/PorQ family protein [Lentisphaerota bacterium]